MHESNDRRAFVERVAAAIAGLGAAGVAGTADAKHGKKTKVKVYSFSGNFSKPTYQIDPAKGDPYYLITFRQKDDLKMRESGHKGKRNISGQETFAMMLAMSRKGDLKGKPAFRIEDINWRLHRASFDAATATWTLHASVCSTNPDARPDLSAVSAEGGAETEWYYGMKGDGCGCNACNTCWICGADNSHHCSDSIQFHCR
ncbi:MAG: hypothetical protein ACR2J8_02625 [Thermomicrobiales bacterium]